MVDRHPEGSVNRLAELKLNRLYAEQHGLSIPTEGDPFDQIWSLDGESARTALADDKTLYEPPVVYETGYECVKCGGLRVMVATKQIRAADEPPTVFYTCPDCGFVRKE